MTEFLQRRESQLSTEGVGCCYKGDWRCLTNLIGLPDPDMQHCVQREDWCGKCREIRDGVNP